MRHRDGRAGLIPEALEQLCRAQPVRALYCTPRFQNPTNATLPLERRQAIVEIARRHDLQVIESDIYGTLAAGSQPLAALAPERTHFLTSLGRIAGPGMKVGCLVSPPDQVHRTQAGVGMSTGAATLLPAEIAARWLSDGSIDTLAEWQREENQRRLALVLRRPQLAGARHDPLSPHVWLQLPDPWRADDFVDAAGRLGIAVAPSHSFVVGRGSLPHAVRFCIGSPLGLDALEVACDRLDRLLSSPQRANAHVA